jgi:hypothetical protein
MAAAGRRGAAASGEPAAAEAWVRTALGPGAAISQHRRICGLWSDYGSVEALRVAPPPAAANAPGGGGGGGGGERSLVLKDVRPPRGDSSVGHLRKVASYVNECVFYSRIAPWVLSAAGAGGRCALPSPFAVAASPPDSFRLLLSDLTADGYGEPGRGGLDLGRAQAALAWLAEFHALFWEEAGDSGSGDAPPPPPPAAAAAAAAQAHATGRPDAARLLAERGTYWYLATRREELAAIPARGEWGGLAAAAPALDAALSGAAPRRGFSIVHGDFKSENILFGAAASAGAGDCKSTGGGESAGSDSSVSAAAGGWAAAAYDFQYVGRGCVMADVAYLLATSVDANVLRTHEAALLEGYRSGLLAALQRRGAGASSYPPAQATAQFELCLADFARFQAGWGWWGAARWTGARTRDVLGRLDAVLAAAAGE